MAENLRTTIYASGDTIPIVTYVNQWVGLQGTNIGAWCHYNNDSLYENPYGKLYNWNAVTDPRNVCPAGWHLPSDAEWNTLIGYLDPNYNPNPPIAGGGIQSLIAGGKMKSTGTQYWQSPNTAATNEIGFSGVPGGSIGASNSFGGLGTWAGWWTSSTIGTQSYCTNIAVNNSDGSLYWNDNVGLYLPNSTWGCSVRCLEDSHLINGLNCDSANNLGYLWAGGAASGISSSVPYTGGNGSMHSGQVVNSTGVTGLTATLAAGSFANGSGTLTYIITGTPASIGTASFALNIGGQSCTLNRTVAGGIITALNCDSATNSGNLTAGTAASGVSSTVPYSGGNGGAYNGQTVSSTGVTGLTATLMAGTFANGSGTLTYTITGTPVSSGSIASFALNICGQSCTLSRTVKYCQGGLCVGDTFQGGIIAYFYQPGDTGYVAGQTHGFIAAPYDQSAGIQWYNGSFVTTNATDTAIGIGASNTALIISVQGAGSYAASICTALSLGGYSNWYLPSLSELEKLYTNLHLQAIGNFNSASYYYSSTEYNYNANLAWEIDFDPLNHHYYYISKQSQEHVRAVRAF